MMEKRHALILLSTIFLVSCGDDEKPVDPEPIAPDENLVGSWALDSTDMIDVMVLGLRDYLSDAGADQDEIDELIKDFRASMEEDFEGYRSTVRFNSDGSWVDDSGGSGTWRVDGNTLIIVEEGKEERVKYFVDGDDLTIILSSELLLDALREDGDFSDEDIAAYSEIFDVDDDTQYRFFYKRR